MDEDSQQHETQSQADSHKMATSGQTAEHAPTQPIHERLDALFSQFWEKLERRMARQTLKYQEEMEPERPTLTQSHKQSHQNEHRVRQPGRMQAATRNQQPSPQRETHQRHRLRSAATPSPAHGLATFQDLNCWTLCGTSTPVHLPRYVTLDTLI
ncbi:Hypothetical predicted protein [Pelobates cultripes]|uniref:Uncharacterized protein n=1 Tax=Pelobates cultripes TaxID=61616 RepID=A0AAD1WKQ8_PELCU|nr:Hypothetical predicted protein [Pelobates cultripes]